jgi:hypothetical protein
VRYAGAVGKASQILKRIRMGRRRKSKRINNVKEEFNQQEQ